MVGQARGMEGAKSWGQVVGGGGSQQGSQEMVGSPFVLDGASATAVGGRGSLEEGGKA